MTAAQKPCAPPNKAGLQAASASSLITFQLHQHRFTHLTGLDNLVRIHSLDQNLEIYLQREGCAHRLVIQSHRRDLKLWMAACLTESEWCCLQVLLVNSQTSVPGGVKWEGSFITTNLILLLWITAWCNFEVLDIIHSYHQLNGQTLGMNPLVSVRRSFFFEKDVHASRQTVFCAFRFRSHTDSTRPPTSPIMSP